MVHRRQVDNETLVFGVHGALLGNAMTWWDHDSGSIWSQPTGEAIAGPRKGQRVELLPSTFTTWGAWVEANPDTLALEGPAGPSGFNLDEFEIVVDFSTDSASYPVRSLKSVGVVNDVVADLPIAVVSDPNDPDRWAVFLRRVDDQELTLSIEDGELVDAETGTTWDPVRGFGLEGPLKGEILDLLPAITSFPGDVDTFWPGARRWRP